MDIKLFSDLFDLGLHPLPIKWNAETKQAEVYPEHITDVRSGSGKHDMNDVQRWLSNMVNANGIALKLHPPFFMFDFDLKNTTDKTVYQQWFRMIEATNSDALRKVCIEETRSGGFHVYAKYSGVSHKKMLASSEDGHEVISIYTGGLLSFCAPTPDYNIIHNDFSDIEELTADEFDMFTTAAMHFNKYYPKDGEYIPGEVIEYPVEYESVSMQFDNVCTDEIFEGLLNMIELYPVKGGRNIKKKHGHTYYLYLRKGSTAFYSAKVRFDKKRLFILSGSFSKFPNFHTRIDDKDKSWRLTPTKIIFYIYNKDWQKTIEVIKELCTENNLPLVESKPITSQPIHHNNRLKFPIDIFPEVVQQYITAQSIQNEYLCGAILAAVSTSIGNTAVLYPMPGYKVKPVLYLAIVAPPGASKSPAINKAFEPLEKIDQVLFERYEGEMIEYKKLYAEWEKNKKEGEKPEPPFFPQTLIKDSTIEMVAKILTYNTKGCCLLADELVGFLNRMNQYKAGDEVQKWLELWSGEPVLIQRITREANKITDPFCGICGGIQPGVLEAMSREENQHNGFYHRFLFVYPEPQAKNDWSQIFIPVSIKDGFSQMFKNLTRYRMGDQATYTLSDSANELYKKWFDFKNKYYNRAINDNVKGIIAKYQNYCLRFSLIIEIMQDTSQRTYIVGHKAMERAIRLTEYFLGNMNKAIKILAPETPADKLQGTWLQLFNQLPANFTTKTIVTQAGILGIKESNCKVFLLRQEGKLFRKLERGEYEKLF